MREQLSKLILMHYLRNVHFANYPILSKRQLASNTTQPDKVFLPEQALSTGQIRLVK